MILNQANALTLYTGFKTVFSEAFDAAESQYERIAMTVPSGTRQETYGWLGKTTQFREWLGDRVIQSLAAHDYTIKNRSFENTFAVDRDDVEDDQFGVYRPMAAQLGQDAKQHPDELVFGLLKTGFTALGFDGKAFFATDHPNGTAAAYSNSGGGSGTAWYLIDASRAIKPVIFQKRRDYSFVRKDAADDDNVFMRKQLVYGVDARVNVGFGLPQTAYGSKQTLNADNYALARAAMLGFQGETGKPLAIRPSLLLVPPSLEAAGREVLMAERDAAGATNVWRDTAQLLVSPWLV